MVKISFDPSWPRNYSIRCFWKEKRLSASFTYVCIFQTHFVNAKEKQKMRETAEKSVYVCSWRVLQKTDTKNRTLQLSGFSLSVFFVICWMWNRESFEIRVDRIKFVQKSILNSQAMYKFEALKIVIFHKN